MKPRAAALRGGAGRVAMYVRAGGDEPLRPSLRHLPQSEELAAKPA